MTKGKELTFLLVLTRMRSLGDINLPPPKVSRIKLPRSKMMQGLVEDTNARLATDQGSFQETKRMKGIFPFPLQVHKKYYPQQDVMAGPSQVNDSMADLVSSVDATGKRTLSFLPPKPSTSSLFRGTLVLWCPGWIIG